MRATTLVDADRKELIVPNKEFVTGRILNWTLSDRGGRVVIPVGIPYGADVPKALELLRHAADGHPEVLADPAPSAAFVGFGEKSMNLELRVFVRSVTAAGEVRHELNSRIAQSFQKAGIVMTGP
jgi:potassium efflux system protein